MNSIVSEIYVICHDKENVTKETATHFVSGWWKIKKEHIRHRVKFALHEHKNEQSYMYGEIEGIDGELDNGKIAVRVRRLNDSVAWFGGGTGVLGYKYEASQETIDLERLDDGVERLRKLIFSMGVTFPDSARSPEESPYSNGLYYSFKIGNSLAMSIWLDDAQAENEHLFYCGFSHPKKEKIEGIISACPIFANQEIGFLDDDDWQTHGTPSHYRLKEPLSASEAMMPIREGYAGEHHYWLGLYQYIDEKDEQFLERAADFVKIIWSSREALSLNSKSLLEKAKQAQATPGQRRLSHRGIYPRNPYIAEWARRRSKGSCEACGCLAPFKTYENQHYLEAHHIKPMGSGGADLISNVAAICPTCHRKIHHGIGGEDINSRLRVTVEAAQATAEGELEA